MNKNFPFCFLAYGAAIFMFSNGQQWFFLWLMMELSTLGFISIYFYEKISSESITLYFLIQSVASFFVLIALTTTASSPLAIFNLNALMIGSILLKLGMFPFHMWVPAVAAPMQKTMAFMVLIIQKFVPFIWLLVSNVNSLALLILLGLMNLLWVSPQNLFQTSMKLIIILSSVSHSSWMIWSLISKFTWEIYFSVYVTIMFCVMMLFTENLKSLFQKNERTPLFLIFLTLGGIPPFMGFYPKLFLLYEILQSKLFVMLCVFLLVSLLDLVVYSRLSMTSVMKNKSTNKWKKPNENIKWFILVNMLVTSVLLV